MLKVGDTIIADKVVDDNTYTVMSIQKAEKKLLEMYSYTLTLYYYNGVLGYDGTTDILSSKMEELININDYKIIK